MRRGVALGGFMGVGKSTVGRGLAERLGLPWVDTDTALAERHGPIARQIAEEGEPVFRARERAVVAELCDGTPRVVSTGGGVWADPTNRDRLREHHRLVVLTAALETLAARVGSAPDRPLWRPEAVADLLERRRPHYADAERIVPTDGRTTAAIVEEIERWLTTGE